MSYWVAIMASKTMTLAAILEVVAGLSLLVNKYAALMMIILMSVSIEEGSVIGANSLVNKRVFKNSVVAGVPAKLIKKRI